jgi:anti-anti-sigma regulatory factor
MVETGMAGGEILVELDGTFDATAAWQLRGRLATLGIAHRVVLDFSRVREFHDLAIAVVANGLVDALRRNVEMRGLRDHQHRLFRYFGVDADHVGAEREHRQPL